MPVILALGRQWQGDGKFKASLVYVKSFKPTQATCLSQKLNKKIERERILSGARDITR